MWIQIEQGCEAKSSYHGEGWRPHFAGLCFLCTRQHWPLGRKSIVVGEIPTSLSAFVPVTASGCIFNNLEKHGVFVPTDRPTERLRNTFQNILYYICKTKDPFFGYKLICYIVTMGDTSLKIRKWAVMWWTVLSGTQLINNVYVMHINCGITLVVMNNTVCPPH